MMAFTRARRRTARGAIGKVLLALAMMSSTLVGLSTPVAEAAVPTGFSRQLVSNNLSQPITVRFLPNGQALVSEKQGLLKLIDPTSVPATPSTWMDLTGNIQAGAERGLIDFAIDPDFANNGKFYVYYSPGSPANFRVSAFTDTGDAAGRLASEQVLWTDPAGYTSCCHYGGGLDVGPDGKLWLTTGDKFDGAKSQDLTVTEGKVLRFNTDGSIPDGTDGWAANPYLSPGDGFPDEIWAYGLRNPFRARWDVSTGRFFIGEVGGNTNASWEDLHLSGLDDAGTNYGWPNCEGLPPHSDFPDCDNTPHEDPIFAYAHDTVGGQASITAGEVYRAGIYPAEYDGAFFYGDYAREIVHYLTFDGQGNPTDNVFDDDAGLVVSMAVGADGRLYTVTLTGEVYRYVFTGGPNQPPAVGSLSADPNPGAVGQSIDFDATLIDPDSSSLDFEWDFGDGTQVSGTGSPGAISETHSYGTAGSYNVTLMVDDGTTQVTSSPIVVQIGTPPTATISSPADGMLFVAGQQIDFSAPPPGAGETYEWEVVFTHNAHTHPVLAGETGQSGSFTVSSSGHDYTSDTGYRISLTVTDAVGLFTTTSVDVEPDKTDITIDAVPSGITIDIDGIPRVTPVVLDTVKQFQHQLIAQPSRCVAGTVHDFVSWSHGEAASHTYVVPNTPQTLTATYNDTGVPCSATVPVTNGLAMRLTGNEGVVTGAGGEVTSWLDQTTNNNDVTPVAAGPTLIAGGLNGNDVVSFDGVDDALGRGSFSGLPTGDGDRTVLMVVNYDSNGWGGFSYGEHKCDKAFGLGVSGNGALSVQGWCNDIQSAVAGPGTGWMTQAVTYQGGNGSLYRDGALIESFTNTYNTGTVEIRIGSELDDSPHLDMDLAEVLVYDRALSTAELAAVESWAQATYLNGQPPAGPSVQLNTPIDGAIVIGTDIVADWTVPSGSVPGDQVEVSLDGGTPIVGPLTGNNTFTGVTPGSHTVDVVVTDTNGTPYTNPEATDSATVVVQSGGSSQVPVTDGLVLDLGDGENIATNGAVVDGWLDRSGNGNDLSLGGGDPSLGVTTPTGVPAVSFDGTGDKLERSTALVGLPAGSADRTMFVVAKYDAKKWGGVVYGNNATAEAFGLGINGSGNLYVNGWAYNANTSLAARGNGWFIHSAVLASNVVTQYDFLTEIGSTARTYQTDPQRLVLGNDLGGNYVDMDVAAVLIYDRALTGGEHQQVADHLNTTYLTGGGGPDVVPPVITLSGSSTMNVDLDSTWSEPGYTATDNVDGDITANVVVGGDTVDTSTVGTYVITYDVSDTAGNPATQVTRTVNVNDNGPDTTPPVITLTGSSTMNVLQNTSWSEPGYTATDNVDGDITANVVVGGDTVDTSTVGTYVITYDVSDTAGNPATQVTRTVNVNQASGPLPVTNGLVLNLDPVNIQSSGNDATGWTDASPSGNDLNTVAGDPTTGATTPTGAPAVSFDGRGDKLERTGLSGLPAGSADRTMFVVAQYDNRKWGGAVYGNDSTAEAFGLGINGPGRLYVNGWSYNANTDFNARGNGWFVHSAVVSSNVVTQYEYLTQIGLTARTYQTDPQRLVLGNDLRNNYVDMDVAAVLVYDRALSAGEHQQVANYLNDTYMTGGGGPDITPPVITLSGSSTMNVDLDSTWSEPGYTATDNVDGDITANVVVGGDTVNTAVAGTYVITYDVSDAANNAATQVTRTVNVADNGPDTVPPVITLTGAATMSVTQNSSWTEPGYTATDNVDGDITANVVVGGDTVDTSTVGTYVITYDVSDTAGNPATQVTRTVNVNQASGPLPVTAGLVLDLNGDNILSSGGNATGWNDASPSGNNLDTSAGDPTIGATAPSGAPAVSFDGTGDKLERTGLSGLPGGSADRTMFVVAKYDARKWGGVVYGNNSSAEAFGLGINGSGNLYVNGWAYNANTSLAARGNGWFVHSAVLASNVVTQYDFLTQIGSNARLYQTNTQRLVLGNDLGSNYVDMDVAAVLIYDRALSAGEHQQVANYLNDTYLN